MTLSDTTGTIFNIQQFTIHDGPGLRTTLFLKGCPLHCPWCSNPESILPKIQIKISKERCQQCGACMKACPTKALWLNGAGGPALDIRRCNQCMVCAEQCPAGAIAPIGRRITAKAAAEELLKDEAFYRNTGGGVTISGGEPLLQHPFTSELLERLKQKDIHTVLDTTGFAPAAHLERVLPYTDLILFDIKHLDQGDHVKSVGVENGPILSNLKRIGRKAEVWLRVPLIPGFNDHLELMDRIVALGRESGASRVCFMPIHRWGEHKYESLGMENTLRQIPNFTPEQVEAFQKRYRALKGYVSFPDT